MEALQIGNKIKKDEYTEVWENINRYRPFKNAKECVDEMSKHSHFGWIKVDDHVFRNIVSIEDEAIKLNNPSLMWTYEELFYDFTFLDDMPFGILETT